jgi:hypothetical protein
MAAVAGHTGSIFIMTNASSISLTNEAMTDSGDHTTYFDSTLAHVYWDDTAVPVVQVDTVGDGAHYSTVSSSTYTVQYVGGKIIFNSANTAISLVRISSGGKYFAYSTLAQGTNWEFSGQRAMADSTVFGGGRAKTYIPTLTEGTFTIKLFWIDSTFLTNLTTGFRLVFSGVVPGGKRYEAYSYIKDDKVHDALAGLIEEDVTFQVTGNWYYN